MYTPKIVNTELFDSNTDFDALALSDASSGSSSSQVKGFGPIVGATVVKASRIGPGEMSPELRGYYETNSSLNPNPPGSGSETGSKVVSGSGSNPETGSGASETPRFPETVGFSKSPEKSETKKPSQSQGPGVAPKPPIGPKVSENPKPLKKKSDAKEPGVTKLIVYHMKGCGHCLDIMEEKQGNDKTKFEQLTDIFAQDQNIQVLDFQLSRDPEASRYNAFPVILLVTGTEATEYRGPREVTEMAKAVIDKKMNK